MPILAGLFQGRAGIRARGSHYSLPTTHFPLLTSRIQRRPPLAPGKLPFSLEIQPFPVKYFTLPYSDATISYASPTASLPRPGRAQAPVRVPSSAAFGPLPLECHPERSEGSAFLSPNSPRTLPEQSCRSTFLTAHSSLLSVWQNTADGTLFHFFPFSFELSTVNCLPLSPFPATLADHSQHIENAITLSPVLATLTDAVSHNSFPCHSYEKHRGVGYTTRSKFLRFTDIVSNSFAISTSENRARNSRRIRTYRKTPGGGVKSSLRGSGNSASLRYPYLYLFTSLDAQAERRPTADFQSLIINRRPERRSFKERLQAQQDLRKVRCKRSHCQNADRHPASRINSPVDEFPAVLGRVANVHSHAFVGPAHARRHGRLNFRVAQIPAQHADLRLHKLLQRNSAKQLFGSRHAAWKLLVPRLLKSKSFLHLPFGWRSRKRPAHDRERGASRANPAP